MKTWRLRTVSVAAGVCALLAFAFLYPSTALATPFSLGDAGQFVLLGDGTTYMNGNNSQVSGNIGVGPGGKLKLDSPLLVTGDIYFADPVTNTNYITSGSKVTISGGAPTQNNALITSALSDLTSLYNTALSVYTNPTTNLAPSGSITIGPGNYNYLNVDINSDVITLNGSPSDYIIINVKKELKINHSTFNVTGGIPIDHILWNLIQEVDAGDATKNLTVGGADTQFAGVFLALDRKISLTDNSGIGRFFGGKSHLASDDFKFVSGVTLNAPPSSVPEPSTLLLLGSGLVGVVGIGWRRKHQN